MAAATKPKEWLAILTTSQGETLPVWNNPSDQEIRGFVDEQRRRYELGQPGGPSGTPAVEVTKAGLYRTYSDFVNDKRPFRIVNLSDTKE